MSFSFRKTQELPRLISGRAINMTGKVYGLALFLEMPYTIQMQYNNSSVMALISHIHSASQEFTNKRLRETLGLVSSQGFILYLLSAEGPLTKGQVAQRINRNKSTVTTLTRRLVEEGLVKEEAYAKDSRVKVLSLTKKGKEHSSFTKDISRSLLETCYKGFTIEEKDTLLSLLLKLNANIEEASRL